MTVPAWSTMPILHRMSSTSYTLVLLVTLLGKDFTALELDGFAIWHEPLHTSWFASETYQTPRISPKLADSRS